jgi:hypothetical protein
VPAVTEKLPLDDPAGTVTEAGVVTNAVLSDNATTEPPLGADLLRVTVQLALALDARLDGVHASDDRETDATRFSVAFRETPFSVAVTVAV